jgi:hypothetical protein
MRKLYRFYLHVEGGDSRTAALIWANSDSEAMDKGFEEIGERKAAKMLADAQGDDDSEDVFFSALDVLEEARGLARPDHPLYFAVSDLLWDYIGEYAPALLPESSRANQVAIYREEMGI